MEKVIRISKNKDFGKSEGKMDSFTVFKPVNGGEYGNAAARHSQAFYTYPPEGCTLFYEVWLCALSSACILSVGFMTLPMEMS